MDEIEDRDVLVKRRWPWFAAGGLLFASAAAAAVSVYLLWLPCRGIMWDGTVFAPEVTGEISEACSRRMDEGWPFVYFPQDVGLVPTASQVGGLAMVLATASWIVLVLGLRLGMEITRIALVAAVAPTILAVVSWSAAFNPGSGLDFFISGGLWMSVDVAAVLLFLVLCGANRDLSSGTLVGLAFVLWGATAFGGAHFLVEFFTMVAFNEYNWDTPPGTGWMIVAVLLIAGSASFWFGGRRQKSAAVTVENSEGMFDVPLDSTVRSAGE